MVLEQDAEHARRLRIVLGRPGGYWHPHPQVQATSAQGQSTPQAQPHPQAQP